MVPTVSVMNLLQNLALYSKLMLNYTFVRHDLVANYISFREFVHKIWIFIEKISKLFLRCGRIGWMNDYLKLIHYRGLMNGLAASAAAAASASVSVSVEKTPVL